MSGACARSPGEVWSDRSGATAVTVGILLTVLLGFTAFGVDLGFAYNAKRSAQNAADSAAFSAAASLMSGANNVTDQARSVAASYNFVDGANGVHVTVNNPPATGAHAAANQAVEVIVTQPFQRFFSTIFSTRTSTITARAVAVAGQAGDGCVVALNRTAPDAVEANGNPNVNLTACSLYDDSVSNQAFLLNGSPSLTAKSVQISGSYLLNGHPSLTVSDGMHTGVPPVADPYANVQMPSYGGCTYTGASLKSGATSFTSPSDSPTVFCGGLTINSGANVTFSPGVYVVAGGPLVINGNASVSGSGVTFVLTGRNGAYSSVVINGGANVNLSAPVSGSTAGLIFYQDRSEPQGGYGDVLNGGSTQVFRGALYFPGQRLTFNGNTSAGNGGCTQVVADTVVFNGNAGLAIDCAGMPIHGVGGFATALVE